MSNNINANLEKEANSFYQYFELISYNPIISLVNIEKGQITSLKMKASGVSVCG